MIKNEMTQYAVEEANTSWGKLRLIWIIVFVAGLVFVGRDSATARDEMIGLGQIHRLICMLLLGIFVLKYFLKNPAIPFKSIFFFLTLFAIWQVITVMWSTFPPWTLYRGVEYLIMILITAYFANSLKDSEHFYKWVDLTWWFVGFLVFSVWASVILFPHLSLAPSKGIIPFSINGLLPRINSNSVSAYGAIIGIVSFVRLNYSSEKKWKILFLLAIVTMVLSQGRSGIGGFAFGIIIAIMLMRRAGWALIIATLIGILITYYAFDELFWEFFRRGQTEDQFFLFSGRVTVWQYTYDNFIQHQPLMGFGAYSAGRFLVLSDYLGWSSLHSTWVELAVGNGIPATIFFALIIISSWIIIIKYCIENYGHVQIHYFIEIAAVYTLLIFRSFFSTYFSVHNDFVFFLVMGSVLFIAHNKPVNSFSWQHNGPLV